MQEVLGDNHGPPWKLVLTKHSVETNKCLLGEKGDVVTEEFLYTEKLYLRHAPPSAPPTAPPSAPSSTICGCRAHCPLPP